NLKSNYNTIAIHVDVNLVNNEDEMDIQKFKEWRPEYKNAEFIKEEGKYICGYDIEKMSKSKYNVLTPDDFVKNYGADTLRLYEMFLGPLEQSKPWDPKNVEGVHRFLKKFWRLFHHENGAFNVSEKEPEKNELKIIHKTIKQIQDDIERFSFNTVVSNLMIAVNELADLKCNKKTILEKLVILISPYAPHIAEELWNKLGYEKSVFHAQFPDYDEEYLKEEVVTYPISFNGKKRFTLELPAELTKKDIEKEVLNCEKTNHYLKGSSPKKIIVVPNKIVNVVH
ncbi:MAG: class I tRNA ligase family protein, partial [Flavobacteriales bacterium]